MKAWINTWKRIRIALVFVIILSLTAPGTYIHADESELEEVSESQVEEIYESEESQVIDETEDSEIIEEESAVPTEESSVEEDAEEPDEAETSAEDIETESVSEEPTAEETEVQITEVGSAEEAAMALANMEADDPEARLIVFGDRLPEETGASEIIYYEEYDEYILQFSSPEEATVAQADLEEDYEVYQDEVLTLDDLCDNDMGNPDSYSWGTTVMGVDPYISGITTSETVTVAVLDTGVDPANPFFPKGVIRADSRDLAASEEGTLTDLNGHGTHVCGIIADMTPDQVKILALRVFDDAGKATWSRVSLGVQYCLENDVDVINLSFGQTKTPSEDTLLTPFLQMAKDEGIVIVCASGNDGTDEGVVEAMYPARLDTTIAVSAMNNTYQIWPSSNPGDTIDFCAPGVSIRSAARSTSEIQTIKKSGTSMAAPHIASVFAYLKLVYPEASWDRLYEEVKSRSVDLGEPGKDRLYGWGYPDLTGLFTDFSTGEAELSETSYVYNAKSIKPSVTVTYDGNLLTNGIDYKVKYSNNKAAGTATVKITGEKSFTGTITKTFTILPASIKSGKASLSQTSYAYDGKVKKPAPTVLYDTRTLVKDTDYTVTYKNNKAIGKATITITGAQNYTGTITKTFKIVPATVTQLTPVAGSKKVTVKYKTVKGDCKYQIAYRIKGTSTWSKVNTKLQTSKTITKLKSGKSYQIRIRAYKTVNGTNYIGAWSAIKTVKVK